ncbi:hypothetical protein LWC34_18515 [Kibdelosporangium philippinense]|uniref:Uncharacterized protein n=1 Tax=Kibdelosporangium philippinense TaxID=211113 RepID=A0ABS8ZBD1_9PSEU|nr:hypothetical protein [Kibdelosporangium philippinense]MCE7004802.1 hypothetical protein [Kibdelosporangium philippinense]
MSRKRRSKAAAAAHARRNGIEQAPKPKPSKWQQFWVAIGITIGILIGWVLLATSLFDKAPRTTGGFFSTTEGENFGYYNSSTVYDGEIVPQFTTEAALELTAGLAEMEKAHGICFGWSLTDGKTKKTQAGSSKGRDVPAKQCQRWLETVVTVGYTSDNSTSPDGASVYVQGSSEFRSLPVADDFARLGVNIPALVEDPIAGTGHAALGLPLLMIEAGTLPMVEQTNRQVTPKPLDVVSGSDISGSTWFALYGIGGAAVLCVVLGFWLRSRAKKAA